MAVLCLDLALRRRGQSSRGVGRPEPRRPRAWLSARPCPRPSAPLKSKFELGGQVGRVEGAVPIGEERGFVADDEILEIGDVGRREVGARVANDDRRIADRQAERIVDLHSFALVALDLDSRAVARVLHRNVDVRRQLLMPLAQKVRHLAEEAFGVRLAFVLCFDEPCPFFDLLVLHGLSPLPFCLLFSVALYHITGASFNPRWGIVYCYRRRSAVERRPYRDFCVAEASASCSVFTIGGRVGGSTLPALELTDLLCGRPCPRKSVQW